MIPRRPLVQALCAACGQPIRALTWETLWSTTAVCAIGPCCWPEPATWEALEALWQRCDQRTVALTPTPSEEAA